MSSVPYRQRDADDESAPFRRTLGRRRDLIDSHELLLGCKCFFFNRRSDCSLLQTRDAA
jgi:hypothetical protein